MSLTIVRDKTSILVIRGLLEDLEEDSFMRMCLFQHTLFTFLDVAMKHLNTTGQNMADLQDLDGLGFRYFSSKEEFACIQHTLFSVNSWY